MKRKNTKTAKARSFMQSNPAAAPNEVAARFGMTKQTVYVLRNKMKKAGMVFPPRSEQLATLTPAEPNLSQTLFAEKVIKDSQKLEQVGKKAPKRYGMSISQVYVAEKLGISVEEYAQKLKQMGMLNEIAPPVEDADTVDETLDARALDYGKFIEGAEVMQMLKRVVQNALSNRDKVLAHDQAESMDMIIHKIGRIVNGNPDMVDHWLDIAGYAKLVADRLEGRIR